MWRSILVLTVSVIAMSVLTDAVWEYPNYHYTDLQKSNMFLSNPGSFPSPFVVAVLNQSYCNASSQLLAGMDPVYKRMTAMKNITLQSNCSSAYTAPQTIIQAKAFYELLYDSTSNVHHINAMIGDYNPLVSTIAESLNIPFLIVNSEDINLNQRVQVLAAMALASSSPTVGPYADFNNNTFLVDALFYRTYLFGSILGPSPFLGPTVFNVDFAKFQKLGVITDDVVLLSEIVIIDRGPFIVSLTVKQLDDIFLTTQSLNNATSELMDSWTVSFQNCTALVLSISTTYTASLLPPLLESLTNVGFFTSSSVTLVSSSLVNELAFINISDSLSSVYMIANTAYANTFNQPFPVTNISLSLPSWLVVRQPIVSDPIVRAISTSFYYLTMQLVQLVYQQQYISYTISQQNWPPIVQKDLFLRSSVTVAIMQQQYNRCQYVLQTLGVQPINCTTAEWNQPLFTIKGYWQGYINFNNDEIYLPVNSSYTTVNSTTSTNSSSTTTNTVDASKLKPINFIVNANFRVGYVIDPPFVFPCEECSWQLDGYALYILGNLSNSLTFTYQMYRQYDTYPLMMAALTRGDIDLAVGAIMWTSNTVQTYGSNVSLVSPILDSGVSVLMRNDTTLPWFQWFSPYSYVVWGTVMVLMVLLTFVYMLLDVIDPNRMGKRLYDFFASYWYVFGSFTQSSVEIYPITFSTKLLSMVMWFSVIIFVSAYTAAYSSYLLFSETFPFVNSLHEALSTFPPMPGGWNPFSYYFIANSTASKYLNTSYKLLYDQAMKNPASHIVQNAFDGSGRLLSASEASTGVFIGDSRINQWMSNLLDCWLITVGDVDISLSFYSVIALPYNSSYTAALNIGLLNLERLRVLTTMKHFYFDSQCSSVSPPSPLQIQDLGGLYLILGAGCFLSLLSAGIEVVYKKAVLSTARRQAHNDQRFHFGRLYFAKVTRVTDHGLMLKVYQNEREEAREAEGKKVSPPPFQYSMSIPDMNVGNAKMKKPSELGLELDTKFYVKYLGTSPETGSDRFIYVKKV